MGRIWSNGGGIPLNATNLNALESDLTSAPKPWKANTYYTAGQAALSPTGALVTALATHTSASAYDPAQWVPTHAPLGDAAQLTAVAHDTNITVTASSNWGINAQGCGYHDPAGAASAEGAALSIDANGSLTLTRLLAY